MPCKENQIDFGQSNLRHRPCYSSCISVTTCRVKELEASPRVCYSSEMLGYLENCLLLKLVSLMVLGKTVQATASAPSGLDTEHLVGKRQAKAECGIKESRRVQ